MARLKDDRRPARIPIYPDSREVPVARGVCASVCGDCSGDPVSVEVCQDQKVEERHQTPFFPHLLASLHLSVLFLPLFSRLEGRSIPQTKTVSVPSPSLCGGGGGEKMERVMPLNREHEGGQPSPRHPLQSDGCPGSAPRAHELCIYLLFILFLLIKKEEKLKRGGKV